MNKILGFIKANKLAVIIIVVTILLAIGIVLYFRNQESNLEKSKNVFPLVQGSRGPEVEVLQNYLNGKGEALVVDGIFGPRTEEAVRRNFNNSPQVSEENFNKIVLQK